MQTQPQQDSGRLALERMRGPFRVSIRTPGSKSITNRALVLAALADGESTLTNALVDAEDAAVMLRALRRLGIACGVEPDERGRTIRVQGGMGELHNGHRDVRLDLANAGTALRFLTAISMFGAAKDAGRIILDGSERMRQRPISELVDALRYLGIGVEYELHEGFPPVIVRPPKSLEDVRDDITFPTTASSQFISAIMLAAPFLPRGMTVRFANPAAITSVSYVEMTLLLLRTVGVRTRGSLPGPIRIEPAAYENLSPALAGFTLDVEPDASGATYFLGAAALTAGAECTIPGLGTSSIQGDAGFVKMLALMGATVRRTEHSTTVIGPAALRPVDVDMAGMPDAAMTLAVACCFTEPSLGPSTLRGLRTLRMKESDRLAALQTEVGRIGGGASAQIVTTGGDEHLVVTPVSDMKHNRVAGGDFVTYNDHRMAMSLAMVSTRLDGVAITDPGCVGKTYPDFWKDWSLLKPV